MMSQLRTTAYHTLSVDDHYSKEMKESNIKEQARLRCGFFCIGLLIPSAIVLLFTVSNSSRRQGSWRPEPRRDAVGWRTTHQAYVREIRETGKVTKPVSCFPPASSAPLSCSLSADRPENLLSLQDLRVILYGDSITESWRGTSRGQAVPRAEGAADGHKLQLRSMLKAL